MVRREAPGCEEGGRAAVSLPVPCLWHPAEERGGGPLSYPWGQGTLWCGSPAARQKLTGMHWWDRHQELLGARVWLVQNNANPDSCLLLGFSWVSLIPFSWSEERQKLASPACLQHALGMGRVRRQDKFQLQRGPSAGSLGACCRCHQKNSEILGIHCAVPNSPSLTQTIFCLHQPCRGCGPVRCQCSTKLQQHKVFRIFYMEINQDFRFCWRQD